MFVDVGSTLVSVALSFALIPWLGFVGAPITATFCDILRMLGVSCLAFRDRDFRRCWPGLTREALRGWGGFLKLSCPSLLLLGIEWWAWDFQSFLAGFISTAAQATQAVAPQVADVQYAVGSALNVAGSTVIGNLLGEGRAAAARKARNVIMLTTTVLMLAQLVVFLALQAKLPALFTTDKVILANIVELYPLALLFSFVDSFQCAFTGILIGAGRQAVAAPIIFVCYWVIGVPLGSALAFGATQWGLHGLWTGMLVAVTCHAVVFGILVLRLDWDKIVQEVRGQLLLQESASGIGTSLVETAASARAVSAGLAPDLEGIG